MQKKPPFLSNTIAPHSMSDQSEFSAELSQMKQAPAFERRILKLVKLLGQTEYSLIRLDVVRHSGGQHYFVPRLLLCSEHDQHSFDNVMLSKASVASARTRHLSMLYHFIASNAFDDSPIRRQHTQFVLITGAGQHHYYLTLSGKPLTGGYITASKIEPPTQLPKCQYKIAVALQHLCNAVVQIGCRRFPEILLRNTGTKRHLVTPQPQRLLTILATKDATLGQAAKQLGISTNTVNKHMATAKSALGTHTIAGTIWRAMKEGLIDDD